MHQLWWKVTPGRSVKTYLGVFLFGLLSLVGSPDRTLSEERYPLLVLGWLEDATLEDVFVGKTSLQVRTKLDTGADTSSLHAESITFFERDKKEWVRFIVRNREGKGIELERPVRRITKIKRKNGRPQSRPVVRLKICVGKSSEVTEFTLVDRSNFSTTALIGRNFLAGKILVDSSTAFTSTPSCIEDKLP
ncbi:MAG: ATP-dependent zinc protease [Bdellovibrionales bacterium]|nr:ATP-dependent zinc protease [Bdellovibrionales bacterium]